MRTYNKGMQVRLQNKLSLFYKSMVNLIEKDSRVCYIACDTIMEKSIMRDTMCRYPNRVIDVGIAEQNAIDIAVGLALSGKIPYVTTVSSFITLKGLEQIHTNIAYCNVPVRLIASNSGTSAGPTHDAICDIGIINAIPNMTIIIPSCTKMLVNIIYKTIDIRKPIYFKIPQYNDEEIYKHYYDGEFEIGKALIVQQGYDVSIIGVGAGVSYGLHAARILSFWGISARVIDMVSYKPIDRNVIIMAAKETKLIVTVEDQSIYCGLASIISSVLVEEEISCKVIKLGIPDEFSKLGERYSTYYKYDGESIAHRIFEQLK